MYSIYILIHLFQNEYLDHRIYLKLCNNQVIFGNKYSLITKQKSKNYIDFAVHICLSHNSVYFCWLNCSF